MLKLRQDLIAIGFASALQLNGFVMFKKKKNNKEYAARNKLGTFLMRSVPSKYKNGLGL